MDKYEAIRTLQSLAEGYDPRTGMDIESLEVLVRPEVIRALFLACEALEGKKKRAPRPDRQRAGAAWTKEEDRRLRDGVDSGVALAELAKELGRSPYALEVRLNKLVQGRVHRPPKESIFRELSPPGRKWKA